MTVSTANHLQKFYNASAMMGRKVINSDFAFEIEGHEEIWLLTKQVPWAILSSQGEIDVPGELGDHHWQPQQINCAQQGPITLMEATPGTINDTLLALILGGGAFNAKVYEGTPLKFLRYKRYVDCFIVLDSTDRDWENRAQILTFSGTLFYHYFGDDVKGNSPDSGPQAYT